MAEKLRYAILNCRSIDMDNYMLTRNTDNPMEIEEDEPALWFARPAQSFSFALLPLFSGPVCSGATRFWIIFFPCFYSPKYQLWSVDNRTVVFFSLSISMLHYTSHVPCAQYLVVNWSSNDWKKTFAGFAFYPIIILLAMPDFIAWRKILKYLTRMPKVFFALRSR